MMSTLKFPVFTDHEGNRMIFPTVWIGEGQNGEKDFLSTMLWSTAVSAFTGLKCDPSDMFEAEADENDGLHFTFAPSDIIHPAFNGGKTPVWVIGGPQFDAISKESSLP